MELAKRNNVESAPPDLKRIVTTDITPITLPDVPVTPKTDETEPTEMAGEGDVGNGMGGGNGSGGNGGGSPEFGVPDGTGLVGTFYDMKQTPDLKPTDIAATGNELNDFRPVSGWENLPATQREFAGPSRLSGRLG